MAGMGENINTYILLVKEPERKTSVWRLRLRWEDDTKIDVKI